MILSIFPRIEQKKRRKKKGSRANSFINILDYYSTLVRSSDGGKLSKSLIISEKEIRLEERIFSKFPPRRKEERERERWLWLVERCKGEATAFHRVARRKFESSVTRARRNGCQVARTCSAYYLVQVAATRAGADEKFSRPFLHAPPEFHPMFHPTRDPSGCRSMDFYNRILRKDFSFQIENNDFELSGKMIRHLHVLRIYNL